MKNVTLILFFFSFPLINYSQNCNCLDYEFSSSKDKAILTIGKENNKLIICGYKNTDLYNGKVSGVLQTDSSYFLSGFNIFTCSDSLRPLISFGEINIFKIKQHKDFITLDLIMNLPVEKDLKFKYVSLIRYKIVMKNNSWVIEKPTSILDLSKLTSMNIFNIKKDLGWDKLYPEPMFARDNLYEENKIFYAFIVSIGYFAQTDPSRSHQTDPSLPDQFS